MRAGKVAAVIAGLMSYAAASAEPAQRSVDQAESAGDPQERMICKRFIETGSLVKGYRTCKSKREWERERDNIRSQRGTSGSCSSAETGSCGGA